MRMIIYVNMSVKSSDLVLVNSKVKSPAHSKVEDDVCLEVKETVKSDNILTGSGYGDPPHKRSIHFQEDNNSFGVKGGIAESTTRVEIKALKPFVKLERLSLNNCKLEETFNCKLLNSFPALNPESKSKLSMDQPKKLEGTPFPGIVTYDTKEHVSKSKGFDTNKLFSGYKSQNLTYPVTSFVALQNKMEIKGFNPVVVLKRLSSWETSSGMGSSNLYTINSLVMKNTGDMLSDQHLSDSRDIDSWIDSRSDHSDTPLSDCMEVLAPAFDTSSESSIGQGRMLSETPSRLEIMSSTSVDNRNRSFEPDQEKINVSCKLFSCQDCGKTFHRREGLRDHLVSHTGIKSFRCNYCGKFFGHYSNLYSHLLLHTSKDASFSCKHCSKTFTTKTYLHRHLLTHEGKILYTCEHCGKPLASKYLLSLHLSIHTDEKSFPCERCGKLFRRKNEVASHIKIHTLVKSFTCQHCGKSFTTRTSLYHHLLIHEGTKKYSCDHCGKSFLEKGNLKKHLIRHTGIREFTCDYCGKLFGFRNDLKRHLVLHTGLKAFTCNQCDKSFSLKCNLTKHLLRHTDVESYKCDICGKTCLQKSNLQIHLATHSVIKEFTCNQCGKSFATSFYLKRHALTHNLIKPYRCSLCKKTFAEERRLKKHSVTHTGIKAWSCDQCGRSYFCKLSLKSHLKSH